MAIKPRISLISVRGRVFTFITLHWWCLWLFSAPFFTKMETAAPERRWDKWINGSGIRFPNQTLPETTYMFHALYMHTRGLRVIPLLATQCISPESAHTCTLFADYWGTVMKWNCDTELYEIGKHAPQNTQYQDLILCTNSYVYKWQSLALK